MWYLSALSTIRAALAKADLRGSVRILQDILVLEIFHIRTHLQVLLQRLLALDGGDGSIINVLVWRFSFRHDSVVLVWAFSQKFAANGGSRAFTVTNCGVESSNSGGATGQRQPALGRVS